MKHNQELFTQVAKHLLAQNGRSVVAGKCKYRGDNGLKCAVGCLITDENYLPTAEGRPAWDAVVRKGVQDSGWTYDEETEPLLLQLQAVHDHNAVHLWQEDLAGIATKFDLEMPNVE